MLFLLTFETFSVMIFSMVIKSERIGKLVIFQEHNLKQNLIKTVYINYAPVARFNTYDLMSEKLPPLNL